MLKPAIEPPPIPIDSFDKHFAKLHHISSAPGEAVFSNTAFDPIHTPDCLHIVEEDVQAALHRAKCG